MTAVNTTLTGYLRGPASFTIDPAAHGDDTGTVIIAGNLQVDGTQTTINSTSLTVDDLNLTLASGAADSAAANGAGITIDGASASLTYAHSGTKFVFNKPLDVTGNIGVTGTVDGVDIQTLNTTAGAALPKAGGTMTGGLNMGSQNISAINNATAVSFLSTNGYWVGGTQRMNGSGNLLNIGTISSGAITSTGILTLDTSPASNGTGDLRIIPSLSSSSGVGFAGQVLGVNIDTAVHSTHNAPVVQNTWGGVTGATAIALQADDNSYGQFQVWTAPQDSSANDLLVPRFWIAGSGAATFTGNVGIGTAGPTALLHVKKDVDSFIMKVENDGNSAGTSGASYADASDGLWVDTRWNTATNTPFKVTSNSGTTPMMIIKGNGNVGIGTDTPIAPLHVLGNAVIETGSPDLYLATTSASHRNWRVAAQEVVSQGFEIASGTTSAGSNAIADTYTTRFTIKGDTGNVGIGINAPNANLHINKTNATVTNTGFDGAELLLTGKGWDTNLGGYDHGWKISTPTVGYSSGTGSSNSRLSFTQLAADGGSGSANPSYIERVRIDDTGNLEVRSGAALKVYRDTNAASAQLFMDAGEKIIY